VFVIGYLGDWQRPAQVLFERESVRRDTAPSREKGQTVAADAARCFAGGNESRVAATLETTSHDYSRADGFNIVTHFRKSRRAQSIIDHETWVEDDATNTLNCFDVGDVRATDVVAQPVKGSHWDSPLHPHPTLNQSAKGSGGIAASDQELFSQRGSGLVAQPVGSFKPGQSAAARSIGYEADLAPSLEGGSGGNNKPAVHIAMQVRRLTPTECERLQGFPDNYTNIPWRKKPESPDGPRYKALGNSMAVPVMAWIGKRIKQVDEL
jgi:DNA (cytosine-5)-methyltransferase 1